MGAANDLEFLVSFFMVHEECVIAAVVKPTILVNQVFSLHIKVALPHTKVVLLHKKVALSRIKVAC
jgi:hypothetical protein